MNSPLETGLFLPIRFYNTLAEQDRYKRMSEGVALLDEAFVYADCKSLCPFQIILKQYCEEGVSDVIFDLVCYDGNITTLPYTPASWELWSDTTNQLSYFSYLGNDDFTGLIESGKYYIQLTVIDMCGYTNTYYSDYFVVRNCDIFYDTDNYRLTSPSQDDKRLINVTDLRITKQ